MPPLTPPGSIPPAFKRFPPISELTLADIPGVITLFAFENAFLLPYGSLPLNVTEAEAISLVDQALATHRLLGIAQPSTPFSQFLSQQGAVLPQPATKDEVSQKPLKASSHLIRDTHPSADNNLNDLHSLHNEDPPLYPLGCLYPIGCLGRISSFKERPDGSLAIILTGVIRFRIIREEPHPHHATCRKAYIDSSAFGEDLTLAPLFHMNKTTLLAALQHYCQKHHFECNLPALAQLDNFSLAMLVPTLFPFPAEIKQWLLQAPTLTERIHRLQIIFEGQSR
ncbi:LON peptidase substrate-binding domain-containing protein [Entomobacter blattae]|uniref:ATP-dependent protease La (LON) substrate-binding domain protein n=1 Tax=Entomobacter blattae TaxID=2762277 RepID=A0A7H1NR35_9PROT|nr:LON peptidase substrate-binding domain-containing protein [Entomobacter blattae]QNT78245.1 ATP-dependent protease La (LON) substrate-binding domain protein [Entomobacter blattae]